VSSKKDKAEAARKLELFRSQARSSGNPEKSDANLR
jgi:hypothetical protein